MPSFQRVEIIGHLGQDPEVRTTANGAKVANLSIATSERWKDRDGNQQEKTEWHRIVVWGYGADYCDAYLHKGSLVRVEGKIETRKWTDRNGNDRVTTEIKAAMYGGVMGLDRRGDRQPRQNGPTHTARSQDSFATSGWGSKPAAPTNDDVPF